MERTVRFHVVHESCQILSDFLERWLWYLRKALSGTARTGEYHKVWVRARSCKVSHIKFSDRDTDSDAYPSWTVESLECTQTLTVEREREATLRNTVVLGSTAPPEAQLHSQELSRNPSKTDTVLYFCKYFMIQPGKEKFPIILKVESLLSCATKLLKVCDQSIRHKAISTQFKTTFPLQFPL